MANTKKYTAEWLLGGSWLGLLLVLPFIVPVLLYVYQTTAVEGALPDEAIYLAAILATAMAGWIYTKSGMMQDWTTRDILVASTLAIAIGILWVGWTWVWFWASSIPPFLQIDIESIGVTFPIGGLAAGEFVNAFWMIGGVLVAYIIRRPGAAFAGEMIAAVTEIPLTPWGALVPIILGLLQGAGAEAVFASTRYRSFSLVTLCLAGVVAHIFGMLYSFVASGYGAFKPDVIIGLVIIRILGGILLAGVPAKLIGDALVPTGVLDGFAIARERQSEV